MILIAKFIGVAILGYILGSIPFGVIISRQHSSADVLSNGSGKIGTTNVLRTAGRTPAIMVGVLDVLKGVLAVVLASVIIGQDYITVGNVGLGMLLGQVIAGLAAVVGHTWSIFLKFKGGRGVATFFGGLVTLCPAAAIFGGEALVISAGLSGFASLGSLAGVVGAYVIMIPLTLVYGFPLEYLIYTVAGTLLIFYSHRDNMKRLLAGKERRIGEKATPRNPEVGSAGIKN